MAENVVETPQGHVVASWWQGSDEQWWWELKASGRSMASGGPFPTETAAKQAALAAQQGLLE